MKRYLPLAAAALLLSGCEAITFTEPVPDFNTCYTMKAELEFSGFEAAADVTRNSEGCWDFCFTEPPELMGITLSLENGEHTASLGELSLSTKATDEWHSAPALISEGLDSLSTLTSEHITENEGILTLTTQLDGKPCQITADKATGRLISLRYPHGELAAYFSEQEEIAPPPESADSADSADSAESEEQVGLVIE